MNKVDKVIEKELRDTLEVYKNLTIKTISKKSKGMETDYELEGLKNALLNLTELINIIEGNKVSRIISTNALFSINILTLILPNHLKKRLVMKAIETDIENLQKLIDNEGILLTNGQKEIIRKYKLSNEQFFDLLEIDKKQLTTLPIDLQGVILDLDQEAKEQMHLQQIFFDLRDHYFKKRDKFTWEDFQKVCSALEKLELADDLMTLLIKELLKEIIDTKMETKDTKDKEPKKEPTKPIVSSEISQRTYTASEKERRELLQEVKTYYDLVNDKPIRSLNIKEKSELVEHLTSLGYSEKECQRILQNVNKAYKKTEHFGSLDYLEKIELALLLRKTFYSENKIREILKSINTGLTKKYSNQSKKEKEQRNSEIYNLFYRFMKNQDGYSEIEEANQEWKIAKEKEKRKKSEVRRKLGIPDLNEVVESSTRQEIMNRAFQYKKICEDKKMYEEIKGLLKEAREFKKEQSDWKGLIRELLEEAYQQSNFQSEIEESRKRYKKIA